jgi:hypothetical protein
MLNQKFALKQDAKTDKGIASNFYNPRVLYN